MTSRPGRPRHIVLVGYPTHAMTSRLRDELARRGHEAAVVHPDQLVTEVVRGTVVIHPFDRERFPDALVLTVSSDHLAAVQGVVQLERAGVPVVNRPAAVLLAADKVQTAVALAGRGVPVPRVVGITSVESAMAHAPSIGFPLVLKAADGAEGNQVRFVPNAAELPSAIAALRASMGHELSVRIPLLLQEAVGSSLGRDRRVFVVDTVPQAAMDRVARAGEWRSNLSQGARPVRAVATVDEAHVASRAAAALGLDFAAIDIMRAEEGAVVIEANPYGDVLDVAMTSGMDLIGSMADLVEIRAGGRTRDPIQARPLSRSGQADITEFCLARLRSKALQLGLPAD